MSDPDAEIRDPDSGGHRAREQLVDAILVTERQVMLAGISTAVLVGGDGPAVEKIGRAHV